MVMSSDTRSESEQTSWCSVPGGLWSAASEVICSPVPIASHYIHCAVTEQKRVPR